MTDLPEMIDLPAGSFQMGCEAGQPNERPVHLVTVSGFSLGNYQITNHQYGTFLAATGHRLPKRWTDERFNNPNQPVVALSWHDAVAYCAWLTEVTKNIYRLPTEAEWEYAARGGVEGLLYPWGNEPTRPGESPERWRDERPEEVGPSEPNGFGLYNMCENVHEWCADWFSASYYTNSPAENPTGPVTGTARASRGGSWRHQIKTTRCAARSSINPSFEYTDYGFRVASGDAPAPGSSAISAT